MTALFLFILVFCPGRVAAQPNNPALPVYLSLLSDPNEFRRFADGGPDGNWYIGFDNAWIVKLPPAPPGDFSRAFIGAKIGRAKTAPNPEKPWESAVINGKIYMAISQTPSFSSDQSYFLAEAKDMPIDPDSEGIDQARGNSEWFWAPVPVGMISFTEPNYLAIWSPTDYFTSASSAPILAAGPADPSLWPSGGAAWNNHSIRGVPPRSYENALETPVNIAPALAIKLVSPEAFGDVSVADFSLETSSQSARASFSVSGRNIVKAWVERSDDQLNWERISSFARQPPFILALPFDRIKSGDYLRGGADDEAGDVGFGPPFQIP